MKFWQEKESGGTAPAAVSWTKEDAKKLVEKVSAVQLRDFLREQVDRDEELARLIRVRFAPELTEGDYAALRQEMRGMIDRNLVGERRVMHPESFLQEVSRFLWDKGSALIARGEFRRAVEFSLYLHRELLQLDLAHSGRQGGLIDLFGAFWNEAIERSKWEWEERTDIVAALDWYDFCMHHQREECEQLVELSEEEEWMKEWEVVEEAHGELLLQALDRYLETNIGDRTRYSGIWKEKEWLHEQESADAGNSALLHRDRMDLAEIYARLDIRYGQCEALVNDFCDCETDRTIFTYQKIKKLADSTYWPAFRERMTQAAADNPVLRCQINVGEMRLDLAWEQVFGEGKKDFSSLRDRVLAIYLATPYLLDEQHSPALCALYAQYIRETRSGVPGDRDRVRELILLLETMPGGKKTICSFAEEIYHRWFPAPSIIDPLKKYLPFSSPGKQEEKETAGSEPEKETAGSERETAAPEPEKGIAEEIGEKEPAGAAGEKSTETAQEKEEKQDEILE